MDVGDMPESVYNHVYKTFRVIIFLILDGFIPATIIFVAYSLKILASILPIEEKIPYIDINAYTLILNISMAVGILVYLIFAGRTVIKYVKEGSV